MPGFQNRAEAGQQLGARLLQYADQPDAIILALPRGGVPIGFEVAKQLHLPLDVFVVRKIGVPGYEELAMGAIANNNICVFNQEVLGNLHISQDAINDVIEQEQLELDRRIKRYRGDRPPLELHNKTVIIVDDGLATGATMRAAVKALQQLATKHIVVAIPVAPPDTLHDFANQGIDIICLQTPEPYYAVGSWYQEFPQTTDEEVIGLLAQAKHFVTSTGD